MSAPVKRRSSPASMKEAKIRNLSAIPNKLTITSNIQLLPPNNRNAEKEKIINEISTQVKRSPATLGLNKSENFATSSPKNCDSDQNSSKSSNCSISTIGNIDIEGLDEEIEVIDIQTQSDENDIKDTNTEDKPSRIIVETVQDAVGLINKAIEKTGEDTFTTTPTAGAGICFQCHNNDTYRTLLKFFADQGIGFRTQEDQNMRYRILIRGLHPSTTYFWITQALNRFGHSACKVINLIGNVSGKPTNAFAVDLIKKDNNSEVLKITKIGTYCVKIEKSKKSKKVYQCHKCQKFNHKYEDCPSLRFICFKCAELHPSSQCPKPKNVAGKCINCNGNHVAIFKGCPAYQAALIDRPLNNLTQRAKTAMQSLNWMQEPDFKNSIPLNNNQAELHNRPATFVAPPSPPHHQHQQIQKHEPLSPVPIAMDQYTLEKINFLTNQFDAIAEAMGHKEANKYK